MNLKQMNLEQIERSLSERRVGAVGGRKYFSVMVLLVQEESGIRILFEQRSGKMKTQPGDVCFPGGRIEAGETPLACALRETEEEIGIRREQIRVLGQFDTLYGFSDITIYTFVGTVEKEVLSQLKLNPAEVETVFTVPYDFFLETEPLRHSYDIVQKMEDFPYEAAGIRSDYKWRVGKKTMPVYHYGHGDQRQIIWGMTGSIASWFVSEMERMNHMDDAKPDRMNL